MLPSSRFDLCKYLTAELHTLGFLGTALLSYPDREYLQAVAEENFGFNLLFSPFISEADQGLKLVEIWSRSYKCGIEDNLFNDVKEDHARLFVGPGSLLAPPWASVYLNDSQMVFQRQAIQVRELYRRFGLEVTRLHQEPDDHIGLEFSFLSYLSSLTLQALSEDNQDEVDALLITQKNFLSEHLVYWAPEFCNRLLENAQTDFYRGLSRVSHAALISLANIFELEPNIKRKL